MDYSTRNKFCLWTILILVILNIALIGLIWFEHFKKPPLRLMHSKVDREEFFARELKLDQEQADSVLKLKEKHFQQRDSIKLEIVQLSQQMIENLFATVTDSALVRELSEKIGNKHVEIEMGVYEHFNEIKQLCNEDQNERLKHLIIEIIRMQQPPPPGHRHPPPPNRKPPQFGQ